MQLLHEEQTRSKEGTHGELSYRPGPHAAPQVAQDPAFVEILKERPEMHGPQAMLEVVVHALDIYVPAAQLPQLKHVAVLEVVEKEVPGTHDAQTTSDARTQLDTTL